MRLSDDGFALIRDFEGYHRKLPDGSCVAYRCPAGVWTLGFGCTKGIREGMVWTRDQAEAALRAEIETHEDAVNRMVTAPINQNQFDALVSFAYNCGDGALQKSTLLRLLNAGDYAGAARSFSLWNKGGGRVLKGLVTRRAREAALFLKPTEDAPEPTMPQTVDPPSPQPKASRKWRMMEWIKRILGFGGGTAATGKVAHDNGYDPMGAISQTAGLMQAYGIELLIAAAFAGLILALVFQHLMKEDVAAGTYTPSGEVV